MIIARNESYIHIKLKKQTGGYRKFRIYAAQTNIYIYERAYMCVCARAIVVSVRNNIIQL